MPGLLILILFDLFGVYWPIRILTLPESEPTDGARTCDDVSAATDHRAAPVAAGAIFKLTMSSK